MLFLLSNLWKALYLTWSSLSFMAWAHSHLCANAEGFCIGVHHILRLVAPLYGHLLWCLRNMSLTLPCMCRYLLHLEALGATPAMQCSLTCTGWLLRHAFYFEQFSPWNAAMDKHMTPSIIMHTTQSTFSEDSALAQWDFLQARSYVWLMLCLQWISFGMSLKIAE